MRRRWIALVPTFLLLTACASARQRVRSPAPESVRGESRELVREILAASSHLEPESRARVPVSINANVRKWIDYFSVDDRERFGRFLERGNRYRAQVHRLLRGNGIPKELYYLAMIESGYQPHAVSPQKAVGVWQFMRPTAERYGLRCGRLTRGRDGRARISNRDDRRDVGRSTRAAARYLSDLHDEFDSWYLAIAAYNAGEGRIRKAIERGGTRNFWLLARFGVLPRETMEYVPKFLAALIIGRNPQKYGFHRRLSAIEKAGKNGG